MPSASHPNAMVLGLAEELSGSPLNAAGSELADVWDEGNEAP